MESDAGVFVHDLTGDNDLGSRRNSLKAMRKLKRKRQIVLDYLRDVLEEKLSDAVQYSNANFDESDFYSDQVKRLVSRTLEVIWKEHVDNCVEAIANDVESALISEEKLNS